MSLLLLNGKATISNDQHIWVVPMSGTGIFCIHLILEEITFHTLPGILDVPGGSPGIGSELAPLGDILVTPVTD